METLCQSDGTFAERAWRMMLAVGAYSGPRAVCGAVAQLAQNARHVVAAIKRSQIGVLGWLGFMEFGWFTWIGSELTKKFS